VIEKMCKEIVTLRKRDGTELTGLRASVQAAAIFLADPTLDVDEGDTVIRRLPSGKAEHLEITSSRFIVQPGTEDGYHKLSYRRTPAGATSPRERSPNPGRIFVVHGRNTLARDAVFRFLRALDISPIEWSEAVSSTSKGAPFVGEVLERAFSEAQAVVVLLTGDDLACLQPDLRLEDDPQYETLPFPQPRPNVLFEAGMAFGTHADRTILVKFGEIRPFSDIAGRHVVRLDNSPQRRKDLAQRLERAGCSVNTTGDQWLTEGDFDTAAASYRAPDDSDDSPQLSENGLRVLEALGARPSGKMEISEVERLIGLGRQRALHEMKKLEDAYLVDND
jgi:predicted nucleotide-binding protein